MFTSKAYLFALVVGLTSGISTVIAFPSAGGVEVPKTNGHTGVGVNLPKERADPADAKLVKREETGSPTGEAITKDAHVDTEVVSPFGDTKF